MSKDKAKLLESVIHITGERDKQSLIKVLLETLSNLIDYDALILLNVPRHANGDYLEAAASIPATAYRDKLTLIPHEYGEQRIQPDKDISRCISRLETITGAGKNQNRIIFPVKANNCVTGILDVYGHKHSPDTKILIQNFLTIYSNFFTLLDDNEHDTLTGLLNRKTFENQLNELLSGKEKTNPLLANEERRSEKTDTHYWVAILDIDCFKNINDTYGHTYGDEVLLVFAEQMRQSFRSNDLLFRYGGEEFIVVLTPTNETDAEMVLERFREHIEKFNFPQVKQVTVSIGFVSINSQVHTTLLLEHADQALYYAKEHGRNQICNYHKLTQAGLIKARDIVDDIEIF